MTSYITNIFVKSQDLEELRRIFDNADTNKSGTISEDELVASMGTVRSLLHLQPD